PVFIRKLEPTVNLELGALVTQRWEDYTQFTVSWYRPEFVFYLAIVGRTKVW
ncbi:MAG: hypothetical protein H7Z43_13990, partial [Clostridia bacterium]|nr:hypothetical protein [Deltaproteobacteria bacterium]